MTMLILATVGHTRFLFSSLDLVNEEWMIPFVIHGERFMHLRGVFLVFKGKASSYIYIHKYMICCFSTIC